MQQAFLTYVKKRKLCTPSDKILVAVSGGIDSMVLLDLLSTSGFDISVAHVNFKLRGVESDKDEAFVQEVCRKKSIPFFTESVNTIAFAEERKLSIQMAAREWRYTWFQELMEKHSFDLLATAHHANDSIETALLNLVRGSGLEGWDGISATNGSIIRPLLFASKTQIQQYATDRQITWREDGSNATDDYQRNFVRHQVMPLLSELNPSVESSFSDSSEKISAALELMELGMTEWKKIYTSEENDSIYLLKEAFDSSRFPEGLLWNLLRDFGFNFDQCTQVIHSLHEQSGKLFYAGSYQLAIDRTHLILSSRKENLTQVLIGKEQTEAQLGNQKLLIQRATLPDVTKESNRAFLDAEKLPFPLIWRLWKEGDFFYPLGMAHKKKLSDFLIDLKISVSEKESVTVLESSGNIVWVVGLRIDDRYKLSDSTKEIISLSLTRG